MKKRILTGITTTGTPHIGNYLGAIKPALELVAPDNDSYFFLADYHALIKQNNPHEVEASVKNVALAWLSSGLDPEQSYFYRQSDIPEVHELTWILNCSAAKGLLNRAHAYKSMAAENVQSGDDEDRAVNMGLFSYPVLMAADILIFNATHVPVGPDQAQHMEMARDIAGKFNHTYSNLLTLPEALIQNEISVPGNDGRKMSKSYNNIIPFLSSEKVLQKSISQIITNSLEPGVPKDHNTCTLFQLYSFFANAEEINSMKQSYKDGISWGDVKKDLFAIINNEILPIREKYTELKDQPDYLNDLFSDGARKVRPQAQELVGKLREAVGISKIV
jgi:tryptophanyl-tRNA synthetase